MKRLTIYSLVFLMIDLLIKIIVINFMELYDTIKIIPGFFNITYVRNTGAAFSILEDSRIFFIVITFIALIVIYLFLLKDKVLNKYQTFLYSMLIGGIVGNLVDRIIYGYVIDYLSFNIFGYSFPVFNIADSFIVISVILLVLNEMRLNVCKK